MGKWKAISSRRVDEQFLRNLLSSEDASWESVAHVTATASLARSIRATGVVGMPIATLSDLIIQPGMPEMPLSLDDFPGPDVLNSGSTKSYDDAVTGWQQQVVGRRFRLSIKFDDELRRYARTAMQGSGLGQLLVRSRREFSRTIYTLITAGVSPKELSVDSELSRTAVSAWEWLEHNIPALAAPRLDLWCDPSDFQRQTSEHAIGLKARITAALECAFGVTEGRRVIVHHGFYFFTPPQWALFQLLRQMPNVDQIFIVHDDGTNPAFETWRRFFVDKLEMPRPTPVDGLIGDANDTFRASALRNALRGEPVPNDDLARDLSVVECRNPSELVRLWHEAQASPSGQMRSFAADAKSVERFVRRLRRDGESGPVDLAQLPIGSFLLAIHDCIKPLSNGSGEVILSDDAILEIAASGFLDVIGSQGSTKAHVSAIRRALPFFKGCSTGEQWRNRAEQLHRLILTEVAPLGARSPSASDLERIRIAAENPLRLAPWADLSLDDAVGIHQIIETTVNLVRRMAAQERIALNTHFQFLQRQLAHGMQDLPEEDRRVIDAKVQGFSVGLEEEIDVVGLVDIVAMLLGRTAEFDSFGDEDMNDGKVRDLRGLDSLGMHRLTEPIHITNLADGKFPTVVRAVGWPFHLENMAAADSSVRRDIVDILKLRSENASLSDLYLLWLALDGVQDDCKITMSWISALSGEKYSLSPLVLLLTLPDRGKGAVKARAGGIKILPVTGASEAGEVVDSPLPASETVAESIIERVATRIDPRAGASAIACPRRFALQWVVGQSHAFQSEHHQSILYGNMAGALVRLKKLSVSDAVRAANDLWRHLTPGQRRSSAAKSRLRAFGISPDGRWALTLGGSRTGSKKIDRTYQAAISSTTPSPETIAPDGSGYLPAGTSSAEVCGQCPVRPSCVAAE